MLVLVLYLRSLICVFILLFDWDTTKKKRETHSEYWHPEIRQVVNTKVGLHFVRYFVPHVFFHFVFVCLSRSRETQIDKQQE